jgi:hypothetical protein
MPALRIGSGQTQPGQGWVDDSPGIYLDVDTTTAGFAGTPDYVCSVGGRTQHWDLIGTNTISQPTATGFRVRVQRHDGVAIDPSYAQQRDWYVNWVGIDNP